MPKPTKPKAKPAPPRKRTKPKPTRAKPGEWQQVFIAALLKSPNVAAAARTAGVNRVYAYQVKEQDPAFASAWTEAQAASLDAVEANVYTMARKTGKVALAAAMFLLKSHRRETYGDRSSVELSGKDGGAIRVRLEEALNRVYGDDGDGGGSIPPGGS